MTRFQKFQKIFSIVPYFSTFFIFAVTMFELKRKRAGIKLWVLFMLTFFSSCAAVYFLNAVIMTGKHPVLSLLASGLLLTLANILCVDLQRKCPSGVYAPNEKVATAISIGVFVVVIIVAFLALLLTPSVDIADKNGKEDTSLAVIQLEQILDTQNTYHAIYNRNSQSGEQTRTSGTLKKYDWDKCFFSSRKASGIMTLHATNTDHNNMVLNVESSLTDGNMEIFVIVDGKCYDCLAVGEKHRVEFKEVANKTVVVKVAVESAAFSISVSRECSMK